MCLDQSADPLLIDRAQAVAGLRAVEAINPLARAEARKLELEARQLDDARHIDIDQAC